MISEKGLCPLKRSSENPINVNVMYLIGKV